MKKTKYYILSIIFLLGITRCELSEIHEIAEILKLSAALEVQKSADDCQVGSCEVVFINRSENSTRVEWDFGDGSGISTAETAKHIYETAGTFTVTLSAFGEGNQKETKTAVVLVNDPDCTIGGELIVDKTNCTTNCTIIFDAKDISNATSFVWDFGDEKGNTQLSSTNSYTYEEGGTYTVVLTAKNDICEKMFSKVITVIQCDVVPSFEVTDNNNLFSGKEVSFVNNSTGASSYSWDFGDGATSNEENAKHTYTQSGNYTVKLTVSDENCSKDVSQQISVKDCTISLDFEIIGGNNCKAPCTITLNNQSSNATDYLWDFGDGNTSTSTSPTHIYTKPEEYTISLTAQQNGCSKTFTKNINVDWVTFKRTYGESGKNNPGSILQTSDGGYLIGGSTNHQSNGDFDMYMFKINKEGEIDWESNFGGEKADFGYSVVATTDDEYAIIGTTKSKGDESGDIYLVKTSDRGNFLWEKHFGSDALELTKSAIYTSDDNLLIAGTTFGGSTNDVLLIKTVNASSDITWEKTFGAGGYAYGESVTVTPDGDYVVAGHISDINDPSNADVYLIKTNSNGDLLWEQIFKDPPGAFGLSIANGSDNGFVITGYSYRDVDINNGRYTFIMKTDDNGNFLWETPIDASRIARADAIATAQDGGYIIVGESRQLSNDLAIFKISSTGVIEWNKEYGGSINDSGSQVISTSDGGFLIIGQTFNSQGSNIVLIKTDDQGNVLE